MGDVSLQKQAALSERLMLEGDLVGNVFPANILPANYDRRTLCNNYIHSEYKNAVKKATHERFQGFICKTKTTHKNHLVCPFHDSFKDATRHI